MTVAPSPLDQHPHSRSGRISWLAAGALVVVAVGLTLLLQHDVFRHSSASNGLRGSGVTATQTRQLASFRSVDLAGANNVAVHVDGKQTVTVRGDDNVLRYITTEVENGTLVVGQSRSFTASSRMGVEVTVPRLDSVALSGSGVLNVDGVRGDRFSVRVPGSGLLTVNGQVRRLEASLSGSGDVHLQDLAASDVTASVSGSGRLLVRASRSLDSSLSGSGAIFYSGNPMQVTQNVTGNGAILKSS